MGIWNIVEFESGLALLFVEKNYAKALRLKLPDIGLNIKNTPARRSFSFCIHNVHRVHSPGYLG